MLFELLEALEKNVDENGCAINDVLYDYDKENCHGCTRDCNVCKYASLEQIKKLKEEASEQTVEYINLDALYLLKDKLIEKHNVLFNRFEVTEFERGELDAFTQTLYMIDDIMEKQATSDKTSDKTSETSSDTRKELDNVNRPKHQNMTIRNLVEVGYFKFNVKLDDSYYEFECLPTDFIDFVYGEDFLNQEIIAIEQGTDGKMYVALKEE